MSEATEMTIDLNKFCAGQVSTFWEKYRRPMAFGGFTYATDGRICVRVQSPGTADTAGDFGETAAKLFLAHRPVAPLAPWPLPAIVSKEAKCPDCNATGFANQGPCKACDGTGSEECACCGQERTCRTCNSTGVIRSGGDCIACEGKRFRAIPAAQPVGPTHVELKYDALIRELPNVRFAPTGDSPTAFTYFEFDGGVGLVTFFIV